MDPNKVNEIAPVIRGDQYRRTHQASVIGILGAKAPKVSSRGTRFLNRDRWTVRIFTTEMCKWAHDNPGCTPTRRNIQRWINTANDTRVPNPEILIANTPDELTLRVSLALTGGAYHEAWHTHYSERGDLDSDQMLALVLPRWALVKDWSKYHEALQDWSNIIEDIRIERLGRVEFSGTYVKMCDLQDFILDMEKEGGESARTHGGSKPRALSTIIGTFRDIGLGYNTIKQREALDRYTQDNPKAVKLVRKGPLAPLLREAIDLTREDGTGCLRIALEVVAKLVELGSQNQDSNLQGINGSLGDGERECPACGSPATAIVVRPISDGNGSKAPGKGVATCTVCGYQEEIQVTPKAKGQGPDSRNQPKSEGFEDNPESEKGTPNPSGSDGDPKKKDYGYKPSDTEGGNPDDSGEEGGGHAYQEQADGDEDWSKVAAEALKQAASGEKTGLKDASGALGEALQTAIRREDRDTKTDEAPWNPQNPGLDTASLVQPSKKGQEDDLKRADEILASVRAETAQLRSRLRTVIRSIEMTSVAHGVPKGSRLSSRFLVDTKVAVLGRQVPQRAYDRPGTQIDMTFAAIVVVDESGSMNTMKNNVTRIFCAVTEPFDGLGCATMAVGFRDNIHASSKDRTAPATKEYHRYGGVHYDIFKNWNERFANIRWRFANTIARGGTPMADGLQFAIKAISKREEANRVIFVVTDGNPNPGHAPVIRRQVRLAKDAGVHIVGIGLGKHSKNVLTLFEDSIWAEDVKDIPKMILDKLNKLVDLCGIKRGALVQQA